VKRAPATAGADAGGPSRARFGVVGFSFALAMITYLDRACIGTLSSTIRADLGMSMTQMGYVFSAFAFAYALFEVPSAWWGERIGARRVLARIVVWWSTFTVLTAAATGFISLLLTRFLFGAGEAGAWPNVSRVFSRWIPRSERGRVQGVFFSGAHLAAGLTPLFVVALTQFMSWRGVFVFFGFLGLGWAYVWMKWFRDEPGDHPGVNSSELALIRSGVNAGAATPGPNAIWRAVLHDRNVWLLCVIAFANSYGFYFVITWLPTYLGTLGLEGPAAALYAGLPMIFAVPADLLGGVTTDLLSRRFGLRLGRALVGGLAYLVAASAMLAATQVSSHPTVAALLLATAGGGSMFALAASWASCIEISEARSGIASATMNTAGQVGGILSPIILAWLVERSGAAGQWTLPLQIIAALYFLAAVSWCLVRPAAATP